MNRTFDKTRIKIIDGIHWNEIEEEVNKFIRETPNIDVKDFEIVGGTETSSRAVLIRYINFNEDINCDDWRKFE